jgi:hypothetical protein
MPVCFGQRYLNAHGTNPFPCHKGKGSLLRPCPMANRVAVSESRFLRHAPPLPRPLASSGGIQRCATDFVEQAREDRVHSNAEQSNVNSDVHSGR